MMNTTRNTESDLPVAMVIYYSARLVRASKNTTAHEGQKVRAKGRRRGTWGKDVRRRALAKARAIRLSKRGASGSH